MTTPTVALTAPVVSVGGSELSAAGLAQLSGMQITRQFGLPARAVLTFADYGFTLAAGGTFAVGSAVKISLAGGDDTTLFSGEITGVSLDLDRGDPLFRVVADDKSYKLTLGTTVATFTNMTISDVITKLAQDAGLTPQVSSTSQTYPYLMQADTTFGFISELADRAGYDWWVDDDGALHAAKPESPANATQLAWGTGSLRHFSVRASALHPGAVTVTGWQVSGKQSVSGQGSSPSLGPTASLVGPYLTASDLSSSNQITSAVDSTADTGEAESLAQRTVDRWGAGAVTATGVCTLQSSLRPGDWVAVTECGPASGSYLVTRVEHHYSHRGLETRFVAGDRRPQALVDTLAADRPSSRRHQDLMIGIVTNLGDDEHPGLIKVKFPTLGDTVESAWARVVSVGGGSKRGVTFLPEVNDEVLVGFEGGDALRPVVLGGLFNGQDVAQDYGTQDGAVQRRRIVSRLGHYIELADGSADTDQHIALTLSDASYAFSLGMDGLTAKVPAEKPVTISAGDGTQISFGTDGSITMQGKKITIKADSDVEISGANITIKGDTKAAMSGGQVQINADGQAQLSSSGETAISGSVVKIN